MKLIVDCGSTKADWVLLNNNIIVEKFNTEGFNPNYTDKSSILSIVLSESSYKIYIQDITEIFFYGSGCGNDDCRKVVEEILADIFTNAAIHITHDVMAACHAILGKDKGVACILGTGSNSCLYDGQTIVKRAVSLGYILGDEGSGSHLGKTLLHDYFYNEIPQDLSQKFEDEYDMNITSLIDNIYHKNQVSRYLASFSKFLYQNKDNEYVKKLCLKCFDGFIRHFILIYENYLDAEIGFVGSIAFHFQDFLKECLENHGLKLGKVIKNPIDGLIEYHSLY